MFILYAIFAAIAIGYLRGGRLDRLGELRFAWPWVALGGLGVQLVLFSDPVTAVIGDFGPPIYLASTVAVLAFVVRNARVPGLPIVALGAVSNLVAIVANGGYMPTSEGARLAAGLEPVTAYSNSRELAEPVFAPLTDIFAIPDGIPFSNVFSIGDLLIAVGVGVTIAWGMRRAAAAPRSVTWVDELEDVTAYAVDCTVSGMFTRPPTGEGAAPVDVLAVVHAAALHSHSDGRTYPVGRLDLERRDLLAASGTVPEGRAAAADMTRPPLRLVVGPYVITGRLQRRVPSSTAARPAASADPRTGPSQMLTLVDAHVTTTRDGGQETRHADVVFVNERHARLAVDTAGSATVETAADARFARSPQAA